MAWKRTTTRNRENGLAFGIANCAFGNMFFTWDKCWAQAQWLKGLISFTKTIGNINFYRLEFTIRWAQPLCENQQGFQIFVKAVWIQSTATVACRVLKYDGPPRLCNSFCPRTTWCRVDRWLISKFTSKEIQRVEWLQQFKIQRFEATQFVQPL